MMNAQAALLRGRVAAEALMVDSCTVQRPTGTVTDHVTGEVFPYFVPVYSGLCKLQQTISQAANPTSGGHSFTVLESRFDTPVGSGPFLVGDMVTIVTAPLDPQLVGRVFRIVEPFNKSFATAQRVRVEEVVA